MEKKSPSTGFDIFLRYLLVFLLGCLTAAAAIWAALRLTADPLDKTLHAKLNEVEALVEEHYLFDTDPAVLADGAASGYADTLDKYSLYRDQEEYADFVEKNNGSLCGIGITVTQYDSDSITVLHLLENSPATGLIKPNDRIIAVEGNPVAEIGYTAAVEMIRGEEETFVDLTILRGEEERTISVQRKDIVNSGIYAQQYGNIGYIRISAFNNATPPAFEETVNRLRLDGAEALLFDLRGNGGGLLTAVADMLDYLLPEGDLVSSTDKDGKTTVLYTSDAAYVDMPMAVLVNEKTASAAELFACDLQQYDAAIIVGAPTFGKGVMQTTYSLSDGSSLTLTTSYYNPMNGENYNGVGVIPDVERILTEEEQKNYAHFDPERDPQLAEALKVLSE